MAYKTGVPAARLAAVILPLLTLSALSFGQNDNSQGNEDNYPVVSKANGGIRPHAWVHKKLGPNAAQPNSGILNPTQLTTAYGMNTVPGLGKGATIAIVDAYDAPNAAADLAFFMSTWGVSCPTGPATFTKLNQNGATSPLPGVNSSWEVETSLDVQWARAVAPCANIVLVEANSNNDSDLMAAVSTAAARASVVSMSWGGSEFFGQSSYDSFFLKTGVTFLASSGDTGGVVEWPSISPNVIGVGGTNLTVDSNNQVLSETAWNGSGGGCSTQVAAIAAQSGFVPAGCTHRAAPDISMNGGSSSPVYTYISSQGGWYAVYGTSLAVQLAGASIGLANGMRATAGNAPLNGTLAALYSAAAGIPSGAPYTSNYRDITTGTAGSFTAGAGWDFITGLGTPLVGYMVPNTLAGQGATPDFGITASPTSQTATQGSSTNYALTVTSLNSFNGVVTFTASNLPAGVSASFSPTSVTGAGGSTATLTTSSSTPTGTYSNIKLNGNATGLAHSATVTLVVTAKPDFSMSASPSSITFAQGGSQKSTITLTSINSFPNTVNLSATSGCPGTCSFSPSSVKPTGSSVMTVAAPGTTPAGVYNVTVQGQDPITGTTHTTTVKVTVVADFTLSTSAITVARNSTGQETVGVGQVRAGDSTSVSLSVSGLPNQASATFAPNPVTSGGAGSTMTIKTGNKTKAGTYTVTVSGTNGTSTHTSSFVLTVH